VTGRRRWWVRIAIGALVFAGIEVGLLVAHGQADELRLALVVALVVCASALLVDAAPVEPATWVQHVEPEGGLGRLDPRTAAYLRILESHLSARDADVGLRGRLRDLADQTLRVRHDVTVDDPRAEELLGAELQAVLTEPPRRLDPDEIARCVQRIEEL
jgi:hypothetical protein